MPIMIGRRRIIGDVAGELARLEALVSALERLGNGDMPDIREIEAAPLLEPFAIGTRAVPCLLGGNICHPSLTGQRIVTSELWVMAPELGWARTRNRLYRLGQPLHSRPVT